MQTPDPFHHVLSTFVKHSGLALDDLEMLSTVPVETIKNWLEGKVKRPRSWQDIVRLGMVLRVTLHEMDTLLRSAGRPRIIDLLRAPLPAKDKELLAPWADEVGRQRLTALAGDLAPHGPLPPGSRMPFRRNPLFVGRDHDLLTLAHTFARDTIVAVNPSDVATTGLGGIGKTQLAVEFVHRYGQFFIGGVFWLSFADPATVPIELTTCGGPGHLNLHPDFARLSLDEQVHLVYAAWQQTVPRLLIFDNCEDPALLQRWRPPTGGCRILITCRRALWDPTLAVTPLPLPALPRSASITLLHKHATQLSEGDPALNEIAAEVGDLPLALNLAGRYLHRYHHAITPLEYLAQLRQTAAVQHPSFEIAGISPTGHDEHVVSSFALSFDRLDASQTTDAEARHLLASAAACAPGELIPRNLLVISWSSDGHDPAARLHFEDAVARLLELGLAEQATDGALRMHRLVASFITTQSGADKGQVVIEQTLLRLARESNAQSDPLPLLPLQVHLRWVTDCAIPRAGSRAAELCDALGEHLWLLGDHVAAVRYVEYALELWTKEAGQHSLQAAGSLEVLGLLRQMQGRMEDARICFEHVLAIREALLGKMTDLTVTAATNLGYLLLVQGDFTQAQRHMRQALRFYHQTYGIRNPHTGRLLSHVGTLHLMGGKYRVARRYLQLAVDTRRAVLPSPHVGTAQSINNLGDVYYVLGDYDRALALHQESLALRRAIFGEEHHDIAESLINIGRVMHSTGEFVQARSYAEQAMRINERRLGQDNFETLNMYEYLGAILCDQDDLITARMYLERALAGWRRMGRHQHSKTASTLYHLGLLDWKEGNTSGAFQRLMEALKMQQTVLGTSHPETRMTANVLDDLGEHA